MARTSPEETSRDAVLRRGYNYVDGNDEVGRLNAGLFFIAFISSPGALREGNTTEVATTCSSNT